MTLFGALGKNPPEPTLARVCLALHAQGLDCGPMSGFDAAEVDATFFPNGHRRTSFLPSIGYGDRANLRPLRRGSISPDRGLEVN